MRQCVGKIFLAVLLFGTSFGALALDLQIPEYLKRDYDCMVRNLHHEARGEGGNGMIAVANVVMNRVKHPDFPASVCAVVYQPWQFSWVKDKALKPVPPGAATDKAKLIAYEAVVNNSLRDITGGALFFRAKTAMFSWGSGNIVVTRSIRNHVYFKYKDSKNATSKRRL